MGIFPLLRGVYATARRSLISNTNSTSSSSSSSSLWTHRFYSSYMRGAVFWEANKPLTIEEFQIPRPKANEVLIKTKACGVCRSDLSVLKGVIKFSSPCVIGHEITGEIVEHGPQSDSKNLQRLPVGSHVVGAFIMPCGNCHFCIQGLEEICEDYFNHNRAKGTLYDGETRLFLRGSGKPIYMFSMGGLAEYCVMPSNACSVLPDTLPYAESSILGCAVFTAYGAIAHAAEVRAGNSIAVLGIGGVGSSCMQIAKAFGASEIIAVDVQDDKLQNAKVFGATHMVNAAKEDVVEKIHEITGGKGVDIAIEALGNTKTFSQCVKSVRFGGKAVMIGIGKPGAFGEVDIAHLVRRKIKIIGSYGAKARQDLPKVVKLAETGIFNLKEAVSRKYTFDEAEKAFKDLNEGAIVSRGVVEIM